MNRSAVFHRPMSEYAHALNENTYVFRLRTARNDLLKCTFFYADRAAMTPDLSFQALPMPRVRQDKLYDWYEVTLQTEYLRVAYYFLLEDESETCCYAGDCFETTNQLNRSDYFQLPFNLRADRLEIPAWAEEAVVYNIFPDSFASGRRFLAGLPSEMEYHGESCLSRLGGTVNGIRENLDYIRNLGCNCIYLNPLFAANSYHKYDVIDHYHIDPAFGTDEEFRQLVKEAHKLGMRVVVDGVFNHISWRHPFFQDVLAKGRNSRYYDWFYDLPEHPSFSEKDEPEYLCFAYVPQMPKTNTAHWEVCKYFCDIGEYWVREYDVDGWRLDVANEMDGLFLHSFRRAVKRVKPDALVIGEVWESAGHYINGNMMDGAMNYDFRRFASQFFAKGSIDAAEFDVRISQMLMRYPRQASFAQLNLLDSHDVSRFLSLCDGDRDRMALAVLFQMTFVGMPSIFYGDEKGFAGVSESEYRQGMSFDRTDSLEATYREMIDLRNKHSSLRRGTFHTLKAEGNVYAYCRENAEECLEIWMNVGDKPVALAISGQMLLQNGWECGLLKAKGFAVSMQ